MKQSAVIALAVVLFFATGCEKEYSQPKEPEEPTFSFKKSTTYDDTQVKTPQNGVMMFSGDLMIDNPDNLPVRLSCRVRFLDEEGTSIVYSGIKSAVTLAGITTSKRTATQSGTDFSFFDTTQNGTQKVIVASDINIAMENKVFASVELTADFQNPVTGKGKTITIPVPKGQIITLVK